MMSEFKKDIKKFDSIIFVLDTIFDMGDQDEISIKHILHGLCSVHASGSWLHTVDYHFPNDETLLSHLDRRILISLWSIVENYFEENGEDAWKAVCRSKFKWAEPTFLLDYER